MSIESASDAAQALAAKYSYLAADTWTTKDGACLDVAGMTAAHRSNVLRLVGRHVRTQLVALASSILNADEIHFERHRDEVDVLLQLDANDVLALTPLGAALLASTEAATPSLLARPVAATVNCPECGRFSRIVWLSSDPGDNAGAAVCEVHGRVTW